MKRKNNYNQMVNANRKGKEFERKVAKILSEEFNANLKRTPQSGGMDIKGDIIDINGVLKDFHWECKNQESLNIWKALQQAQGDCDSSKIPVVVFTRNRSDNYACVRFDDLIGLIKASIINQP